MWKRYEVRLHFPGRLIGWVPRGDHLGFYQDGQGLYHKAGNFRALMKDCARALGIEGLRARVQAAVVEPPKVYLGKSNPDGSLTRTAHLACPSKGSVVHTHDYVEDATVEFQVVCDIDEEVLRRLFEFGSEMSKGREFGHYEVEELKLVKEVDS